MSDGSFTVLNRSEHALTPSPPEELQCNREDRDVVLDKGPCHAGQGIVLYIDTWSREPIN